jgi:hypothetical protein
LVLNVSSIFCVCVLSLLCGGAAYPAVSPATGDS